jgi:hypothetical protein
MATRKKPSAGLTKKQKSSVAKKTSAGKNIGKKGPGSGFKNLVNKLKKQGKSEEAAKKIAAAAMWKNIKR